MILFTAQGVINLGHKKTYMFVLALLQIGVAVLYGLYYFSVLKPRRSKYSPQINLNENEISFFKGLFYKRKTIQHEEIKVVQLKPERISVMTKEYDFTYNFDYEALNKTEIQKEIESYCLVNNLPYEKISYQNV